MTPEFHDNDLEKSSDLYSSQTRLGEISPKFPNNTMTSLRLREGYVRSGRFRITTLCLVCLCWMYVELP